MTKADLVTPPDLARRYHLVQQVPLQECPLLFSNKQELTTHTHTHDTGDEEEALWVGTNPDGELVERYGPERHAN